MDTGMRIIDLHCHPGTKEWFDASVGPFTEELTKYWKRPYVPRTEEEVISDLKAAHVEAVMVAFDAETELGSPPCTTEYVVGLHQRHPEEVIQVWGSVDPWKGELAIREAEHAVRDLGVLGFHFHPIGGAFSVGDERFYPLWETISSLGAAIMVDSSMTGMGAGMRGGGGRRLKYARPFPALDDLAVDFPDLKIVAAHPSWPWTEEMMAIVLHKPNVFWEMSGWGPEYIPEILKHDMSRRLQDKVMFGSDYPSLSFDRLFRGWESLNLRDEIMEKIFHANAERVLDL